MNWPEHIGKETLDEFVQDVGTWASATFGNAWRGNTCFCHLVDELQELSEDIMDQEEIADCIMLLLDLAYMNTKYKNKKPICEVLPAKLSLNKKRKWAKPDGRGVIRHL